jgi:hypothetical protein
MKKIVSPLVLALLLIWTWFVVHSPSAIGFETHSAIQTKLVELIENTLKTKKPDAKDLEIVKIWTTALSDNKVQATFAYRFTDTAADGGTAKKTIQGEAILHREPTEDPTIDKWILQSVKSQMESLNYTEGSEITPSDATADENGAPANGATTAPTENPDKTKEESH